MILPTPNLNNPIPNGPFYSPTTTYLQGPYHWWIPTTTSGFDFSNGTFTGGGGGGTGTVTQINTGTGLTGGPITTTGTISLASSGVTTGTYTYSTVTVNSAGQVTLASSGATPVTQINTGTGLTGGPITTTGTISLASSGVTTGTYTYSTVTVNSAGQVTLASSGAAPLPLAGGTMTGLIVFAAGQTFPNTISTVSGTFPIAVSTVSQNSTVSVAAASTTQSGVVQLFNATNGTSTSQALTAAQGKNLQDQIDALSITSNITLAGTLDTVTGNLVTVTTVGAAAGFAVGSPLPAAAVGNAEYFVIVTVAAAAYTPPGGTATLTHVGDWFLSSGTVWDFLNVGFDPPYASTTLQGVVQLATNTQVQAGTDATLVVTPAGLQTKVASTTAIGLVELATNTETGTGTDATRAVTPAGLSARVATLATTGIVQLEDSITSTSITTAATANSVRLALAGAIPNALLTAKGSIVVASAALTPVEQLVGAAGDVLTVDPSSATGLAWAQDIDGGTF